MDKNTLSEYGWAIIIIIVLIILLGLSLPYSEYVFNTNNQLSESLSNVSNSIFTKDNFYGDDHLNTNYVTNYTAEEIDANELLIPIGRTNPYYVVVAFDKNYTEAVITKNGSASDGYMRSWNYNATDESLYSPMRQHADTLKTVIINDGVKNSGEAAFLRCTELEIMEFGKDIESLGYATAMSCKKLENITIPDKVTTIAPLAFRDCSNLKSVRMNNNITHIYNYAFFACTNLIDINLSTSLQVIEKSAFHGCNSLKEIILPETLQRISNSAFQACVLLDNVIIPESCTKIEDGAFAICNSLLNISLPDTLRYLGGHVFTGCKFTELTIPRDVQTINFNPIQSTKVEKINVHPENKHFKSVDGVLYDISVTKLISVPNLYTGTYAAPSSLLTVGRNAFNNTPYIKEIILNEGLQNIEANAFYYSGSMTTLNISSTVSYIDDNAFSANSEIRNFIVSENNPYFITTGTTLYTKDMSKLIKTTTNYHNDLFSIPDGVTTVCPGAFNNNQHIKTLVVPESVITLPSGMAYNSVLTTIHGKSGSAAETFALENGYTFVAI